MKIRNYLKEKFDNATKLSRRKIFWLSFMFGVIIFSVSSILLFNINFENPFKELFIEFLVYDPDYHGAYEGIFGGIGVSLIGCFLCILAYPQIMVAFISYNFSKFLLNKLLSKKND